MTPRILIADSDIEMLALYRRFLASSGLSVETAKDGLDCLHKLHDFVPDVVVLERELPWGGSDGVVALMRESRSVQPVILMADDVGPENVSVRCASPIVGQLRKPFALRALAAEIQTALYRRPKMFECAPFGNTGVHCRTSRDRP